MPGFLPPPSFVCCNVGVDVTVAGEAVCDMLVSTSGCCALPSMLSRSGAKAGCREAVRSWPAACARLGAGMSSTLMDARQVARICPTAVCAGDLSEMAAKHAMLLEMNLSIGTA